MTIEPHYSSDIALLDNMQNDELETFSIWFAALEMEHSKRGKPYGDGSLSILTGIECWYESFVDGMSPLEALNADEESWD